MFVFCLFAFVFVVLVVFVCFVNLLSVCVVTLVWCLRVWLVIYGSLWCLLISCRLLLGYFGYSVLLGVGLFVFALLV